MRAQRVNMVVSNVNSLLDFNSIQHSKHIHEAIIKTGDSTPWMPSVIYWCYRVRDAPFDIWGGGGARLKLKKIVCRHKSQKKKLLKMWAEKKFVVEIDGKYVDQKKHQMVTYIIGKAYDRKILRHNIKKKILGRWSPKTKLVFHRRIKKKFASNKNSSPPPPGIKWCVPKKKQCN